MKKPDKEMSIAANDESAKTDAFFAASFLIPFLLVTLACRAYISMERPATRDIAAMAAAAAVVLE